MSQTTIGQRIKFILDTEGFSIRKFARALDVSDTNIRNYIERGSKPSSDVLENIVQTFPRINPTWLLLGQGEPFLAEKGAVALTSTVSGEKNTVTNIGQSVGGTLNVNSLDSCKASLVEALGQITLLTSKLESAQVLLEAKDTIIAAKDDTINMLRAAYTRPN